MQVDTQASLLVQAKFDGRAFINGTRVDALSGATFDCYSPVDGRLLLVQVARCKRQILMLRCVQRVPL